MADWCDDDVDDVTYRQQMQLREERRIERELGVHGECFCLKEARLTPHRSGARGH